MKTSVILAQCLPSLEPLTSQIKIRTLTSSAIIYENYLKAWKEAGLFYFKQLLIPVFALKAWKKGTNDVSRQQVSGSIFNPMTSRIRLSWSAKYLSDRSILYVWGGKQITSFKEWLIEISRALAPHCQSIDWIVVFRHSRQLLYAYRSCWISLTNALRRRRSSYKWCMNRLCETANIKTDGGSESNGFVLILCV